MRERQQLCKVVQLNIKAVAMAFGRIQGTLEAENKHYIQHWIFFSKLCSRWQKEIESEIKLPRKA